jgi:competence protein ComFC
MASLLDLVLSPACAACGRAGAVLCGACMRSAQSPQTGNFVVADAGVVVGDALTLAVGAFVYEGAVRRALGRLKYGGARRVAGPLATLAAPAFSRLLAAASPSAVVPVPVHLGRERERGYNQALLLATLLARDHGLPCRQLLERRQATERQHRLDRAARLHNLRDAISVRTGTSIPSVVVVVDDILTTSATLEACASVLLAGGAATVCGFAIAREV